MTNKRIAVIMCTCVFDKSEYLSIAIDSILNQSFPCDILILKNGSLTADLENVFSAYSLKSNVIVLDSDMNFGLAKGLNILIDYAIESGYDFIARMDSDDISRPSRLEKQVNYFNSHPEVDVLGTSCHEFGASFALNEKHLPTNHVELERFSITRCPFVHPTVMFKIDVFKDGVRYPESTFLTEDMALWLEMLSLGYRFSNINEILLDYRLNESTICRRKGMKKALSEVVIRVKYMFILRKLTFGNFLLIFARFFFHLSPSILIRYAYRRLR
ncbi:glycosyl transferase [Pectobacterium brasiliense]|uniref:glycosyltransferase n=1 Tax=Pectobacterium brasiliense TaxID=180957 RepID=UPI0004E68D0E|nr:glycosyltransferase [Pectobacterium brasiliense]KFF63533.1 glycosyl transferase [Pectobacterium brasiliense]